MTRGLHTDTRVQRGDPGAISDAERTRGYEAGDVPAKKVAWGVAAFIAVMVVGLLFAVPVTLLIDRGLPPPEPARSGPPPPRPRLLVDPPAERAAIDAEQAKRLTHIDAAMARVARKGWGDETPAPGAEQAAREHAEALR